MSGDGFSPVPRHDTLVVVERRDTTDRASRAEVPGESAYPFLFLLLEADRPLAGGMRIALHDVTEAAIGRGEARSIARHAGSVVIRVPDRRMSHDHARIVRGAAGRFTIIDDGSANGTRINGGPIVSSVIEDGDVLELGQTLFIYREIAGAPRRFAGDCDTTQLDELLPGMATLDPPHAAQLERLARIAPEPAPLLLLGEPGTGKELLAAAVHALSGRTGPFVAVHCRAIPPALAESHLFGHVKGALAGAVRDEMGQVRAAHHGTLFVDEIGDLPPSSQVALLRVLQEGAVLPVGGARPAKVDVRVVASSRQPLDELVAAGRVRRDLHARLSGFTHVIPPLRERRVDIGILLAALLRGPRVRVPEGLRFRGAAARALVAYDWPNNVRELERCITASIALAEEGVIRVEDLPAMVAATPSRRWAASAIAAAASASALAPSPIFADDVRDGAELRRELEARLKETRGNVSEVARGMGKARHQVQRWLRRFAIDPRAYRDGT